MSGRKDGLGGVKLIGPVREISIAGRHRWAQRIAG
jgi:hypothetical protein